MCNPLGSKRTIHKLGKPDVHCMMVVQEHVLILNIIIGMFYFTLGNVRSLYRSKLKSINLLVVVKSKLVSEYSMNCVLQPIISDIKKLVSTSRSI